MQFEIQLEMTAEKYPRTFHFPFSEGTTDDDRIQSQWQGILQHELVITEKLDGENTCLKANGVYARSHGACAGGFGVGAAHARVPAGTGIPRRG